MDLPTLIYYETQHNMVTLTDPVLSKAILDILTKWRLGTLILPIHYDPLVRSAVQAHRGYLVGTILYIRTVGT